MTPGPRKSNRVLSRLLPALLAFFFCSGFGSGERWFAPNAALWERWSQSDQSSALRIDHTAWDGFIARYVVTGPNGATRLRYAAVSSTDRATLDAYVTTLTALPISRYNRREQLAFWINLYNALTVKVVLEHYPVASIRDINISPGFFQIGPWDKKLIAIEGQEISLNDIEHRILRPIWQDPRLHYALNCASIGCPNLAGAAYNPEALEEQLRDSAVAFVNSPRGVKIDDQRVTVSKIYDWFHTDFGGTDAAVLQHILQYAQDDLLTSLRTIGEIHDVAYDWRLNDAK